MEPTGWWQVLLDGAIGAAFGGLVAAFTAWGVVAATKRHDRTMARMAALRQDTAQLMRTSTDFAIAVHAGDVSGVRAALSELGMSWMVMQVHAEGRCEQVVDWFGGRISVFARMSARMDEEQPPTAEEAMRESSALAGGLMAWSIAGFPDWPSSRMSR